jgi:hypothetical protein
MDRGRGASGDVDDAIATVRLVRQGSRHQSVRRFDLAPSGAIIRDLCRCSRSASFCSSYRPSQYRRPAYEVRDRSPFICALGSRHGSDASELIPTGRKDTWSL